MDKRNICVYEHIETRGLDASVMGPFVRIDCLLVKWEQILEYWKYNLKCNG